ncbi:MAG: DUF4423 domain-containing protein [Myxococcales bacterium]
MKPSSRTPRVDFERLARELLRSLRGRRSCAEFSKRIGYRSNIAQRWEKAECWPTAARFLEIHQRMRPGHPSWLRSFFGDSALPDWARTCHPASPEAVAMFLTHLKGKTPIVRLAELTHESRFSVARWLDGGAQPKLPEFLRLVEASSRRVLDLAGAFVDPAELPSARDRWNELQLARESAYAHPWSHAVLRALELADRPARVDQQIPWMAAKLSLDEGQVRSALDVLLRTGQVEKRRGYRPRQVIAVDTSREPERALALKAMWTETALERLRAKAPGTYGYSVFAVSRADLARLKALHSQYVRAMQEVIASSTPSECVGLYCAQLLDLGQT